MKTDLKSKSFRKGYIKKSSDIQILPEQKVLRKLKIRLKKGIRKFVNQFSKRSNQNDVGPSCRRRTTLIRF